MTTLIYYTDTTQPQVTTIGPAPFYPRQDIFMDELNRQIKLTSYTGSPVAYPTLPTGPLNMLYTYDKQGNQTSVTDSDNYTTFYSYENTGWLLSKVQTATVQGQPKTYTTSMTYDQIGNEVSRLDPNLHSNSASYDVLNRAISRKDALNNTQTSDYDGLGRLLHQTDAKGQITTLSYDNISRLLSQITTRPSSPADTISTYYTYNDGGQPLTMLDQVGSGPVATTTYNYDGLNRPISVSSGQGLVQYAYDKGNRRTQLSFGPDTTHLKTTNYSYDGISRPTTISYWLTGTLTFNYNGSRLAQVLYPDGVTASYGFDGVERLTSLSHVNGAITLLSANYNLNKRGNRTNTFETQNGVTRTLSYQYDELSRLTQEASIIGTSQPVTSTYVYDAVGNRQQMTSYLPSNTKNSSNPLVLTTVYTYNVANQLANRSETGSATPFNAYNYSYTYDPNSSMTSETNTASGGEITNYVYDSRNRLTNWQKTSKGSTASTASFGYDGSNIRLNMSYAGRTTNYLVDKLGGSGAVLQESISGQANPNYYLYSAASSTPLFSSDGATGGNQWYHYDGSGSVRVLSNNTNGQATANYAYTAFGNAQAVGDNSSNSKVSTINRYGGQTLDPTGLLYSNSGSYYLANLVSSQ